MHMHETTSQLQSRYKPHPNLITQLHTYKNINHQDIQNYLATKKLHPFGCTNEVINFCCTAMLIKDLEPTNKNLLLKLTQNINLLEINFDNLILCFCVFTNEIIIKNRKAKKNLHFVMRQIGLKMALNVLNNIFLQEIEVVIVDQLIFVFGLKELYSFFDEDSLFVNGLFVATISKLAKPQNHLFKNNFDFCVGKVEQLLCDRKVNLNRICTVVSVIADFAWFHCFCFTKKFRLYEILYQNYKSGRNLKTKILLLTAMADLKIEKHKFSILKQLRKIDFLEYPNHYFKILNSISIFLDQSILQEEMNTKFLYFFAESFKPHKFWKLRKYEENREVYGKHEEEKHCNNNNYLLLKGVVETNCLDEENKHKQAYLFPFFVRFDFNLLLSQASPKNFVFIAQLFDSAPKEFADEYFRAAIKMNVNTNDTKIVFDKHFLSTQNANLVFNSFDSIWILPVIIDRLEQTDQIIIIERYLNNLDSDDLKYVNSLCESISLCFDLNSVAKKIKYEILPILVKNFESKKSDFLKGPVLLFLKLLKQGLFEDKKELLRILYILLDILDTNIPKELNFYVCKSVALIHRRVYVLNILLSYTGPTNLYARKKNKLLVAVFGLVNEIYSLLPTMFSEYAIGNKLIAINCITVLLKLESFKWKRLKKNKDCSETKFNLKTKETINDNIEILKDCALKENLLKSLIIVAEDALLSDEKELRCKGIKLSIEILENIDIDRNKTGIHFLNLILPNITQNYMQPDILEFMDVFRKRIGVKFIFKYVVVGFYHPSKKIRSCYEVIVDRLGRDWFLSNLDAYFNEN